MLRKGMWVVCDGKIGIAALERTVERTGTTEWWAFHAVEEDGTTGLVYPMPGSYRQATLSEIPESRRPTPEHGARLGYL
jgi:hypothetical protein